MIENDSLNIININIENNIIQNGGMNDIQKMFQKFSASITPDYWQKLEIDKIDINLQNILIRFFIIVLKLCICPCKFNIESLLNDMTNLAVNKTKKSIEEMKEKMKKSKVSQTVVVPQTVVPQLSKKEKEKKAAE